MVIVQQKVLTKKPKLIAESNSSFESSDLYR